MCVFQFFRDCKIRRPLEVAYEDVEIGTKLWNLSKELLNMSDDDFHEAVREEVVDITQDNSGKVHRNKINIMMNRLTRR